MPSWKPWTWSSFLLPIRESAGLLWRPRKPESWIHLLLCEGRTRVLLVVREKAAARFGWMLPVGVALAIHTGSGATAF